MKTVAIFGVGFLGQPLARRLLEMGHAVCCNASDASKLPADAVVVPWRLGERLPESYGTSTVWVSLLPPSCDADYVNHMRAWVQAAEAFGVTQLVYTSTTSVYGSTARHCTETSAVAPETESAHRVAAVEAALLASRVPQVNVLRLGGLYGDSRHPVRRLAARECFDHPSQRVNVVSQEAAVTALCDCVVGAWPHRITNTVSPEHPSRLAFYTQAAERLQLRLPETVADAGEAGKIVDSEHPFAHLAPQAPHVD